MDLFAQALSGMVFFEISFFGTPGAELAAFLASGRSRHVTGATIDITGAGYVR